MFIFRAIIIYWLIGLIIALASTNYLKNALRKELNKTGFYTVLVCSLFWPFNVICFCYYCYQVYLKDNNEMVGSIMNELDQYFEED